MAKERPDHEEAFVQTAALRASIIGWLGSNPGSHGPNEIASAIGAEQGRTRHACRMLAENELIGKEGGGGRGHKVGYFSKGIPPDTDLEKKLPKTRKVHVIKGGNKEVELVLHGFEIVLGRNPATGRLRIVLEG